MEYLGGGEVKWRDDASNPVLTVGQTRRIIRDALLGLEYRASTFLRAYIYLFNISAQSTTRASFTVTSNPPISYGLLTVLM